MLRWTACGAVVTLINAGCLALGAPPPQSAPADFVARGRLQGYAVTISGTASPGQPGRLLVLVSSGDPLVDAQTHAYVFEVPAQDVVVNDALAKAHIHANLDAFGRIALSGTAKGKVGTLTPVSECTGTDTLVRRVRVRGKMKLVLPGIGTVRKAFAAGSMNRRGDVTCEASATSCPPTVGARLLGVNAGGAFLSVADVPGGAASLFASIRSPASPPATSILHSRIVSTGVVLQTAAPDPLGNVAVTVTADGTHGACNLDLRGTVGDVGRLPLHRRDVRSVIAAITGGVTLQIAGADDAVIAGNAAATDPVGSLRENVD